MLIPYFLRCKQNDFPELVALCKSLGIIAELTDHDTNQPRICGINGCDWDLVFGNGQLWKGTGVFTEVEGALVEQKELIVDETGQPYIHINLLTRFDLGDRARAMAADHPELAQALSTMGKYFLLDENGKVRRPANPQCSFGIVEPV